MGDYEAWITKAYLVKLRRDRPQVYMGISGGLEIEEFWEQLLLGPTEQHQGHTVCKIRILV